MAALSWTEANPGSPGDPTANPPIPPVYPTQTEAVASSSTVYRIFQSTGGYMALCLVTQPSGGTMNYNVGGGVNEAVTKMVAQADWDTGTRP